MFDENSNSTSEKVFVGSKLIKKKGMRNRPTKVEHNNPNSHQSISHVPTLFTTLKASICTTVEESKYQVTQTVNEDTAIDDKTQEISPRSH